ncbi:hypothetical protein PFISCL1PPCAC_2067 [Pristionchus fissidentatus]|uniref:Serpin domain-containing protein n=1 Tax=Pristionchus fissidentatus TaxID=1538716 RepID=A0AAV5UYZ8_9BILA|nr:hypothetical protein PFISCL1PPCAC_2067 [Pristionchus fissidentatus]
MVCSAAVLSSSLALSLLRHSSSPSQSFVLSPFSLNSALSIVHDGANGNTQKELTNLLLNGCTPADVTNHYSSLTLSLPSNNDTGVSFKSANRFYVDNSISLKNEYQKHVEEKYKVKVQGLKLGNKVDAAKEMNTFVDEATNGMIRDFIKANGISDEAKSILINAIHFLGTWKNSFDKKKTTKGNFHGAKGDKEVEFMNNNAHFNISHTEIGVTLVLPYENEVFRFFLVMPAEERNLENLRSELTGEKLQSILKNTHSRKVELSLPKFSLSSDLDGVKVLQKLGVNNIFDNTADFTKVRISDTPLKVSKIQHKAVVEVDEKGTVAAAATSIEMVFKSAVINNKVIINRPFLFGILNKDDILFIGQFA